MNFRFYKTMPKELNGADLDRLRLDQWQTLELIEESCRAMRQKLLDDGRQLPISSNLIHKVAAILVEAAL